VEGGAPVAREQRSEASLRRTVLVFRGMCSHGGTQAPGLRVGRLAAGVVVGVLALSTGLSAQTRPMPVLPQEPPAADPADPADPGRAAAGGLDTLGAARGERPEAWEYGLGVGAGWDSNIEFQVPDGPSSSSISPRGNLARVFWGPQGQLRLGGTGRWIGYLDQRSLSQYDVNVGLDGSYRSSLNTTWRASGSYDFGNSGSSFVLAEQGVLLPLVKTRTLAGDLGLTRQLGLRTSFLLDARVYRTVFDQSDAGAVGLVDGLSIRGTASLERKLGPHDTAAIQYAVESILRGQTTSSVDGGGSSYLTHYGSLQWTHILSPRSGFLLEAGGSYTPNAEVAGLGQQGSFYGGASYRRQVKRSSIALFARREVTPAFGLGVSRLENRFGLSALIPIGRAWTLQVAGTHVKPETPDGASFTYSTPDESSVSLGRRLGRLFGVSAESRYRRRGATNTYPAIEGFQAGVFLSLLGPTGRAPAAR
jgi:hypothetical protein